MNATALFVAIVISSVFAAATVRAAEPDTRVFELRTYYAAPGKLDQLHKRFRDHTVGLFEKHGMTNIGYWVPIENPENKLIYLLAYPSREARELSWKNFMADPVWQKAHAQSETDGKLVAKVEQLFLAPTDFTPAVAPSQNAAPRVFELRTYSTNPGNLAGLHSRFRDHTMALFKKHGMTNLFYFQLAADQPNADSTLLYFLAHDSVEASKTSFAAFRANPEWVAAKKASEDKAGGSLTVPDGVKSLFLKATDYSPSR